MKNKTNDEAVCGFLSANISALVIALLLSSCHRTSVVKAPKERLPCPEKIEVCVLADDQEQNVVMDKLEMLQAWIEEVCGKKMQYVTMLMHDPGVSICLSGETAQPSILDY